MNIRILTNRQGIVCIAVLIAAVLSPCASMAESKIPEVITLGDAIVLVLERSPRLGAARYESQAAAAQIRQARLGTPYTVNVDLENFAGSGLFSGVDGIEATLSIARILELGDKPALRGGLAQQKANQLQSVQDAQRLDLLAETARRFIHVVTDQERLPIAIETVVLAQRTLEAVEQRVAAGRTPLAEQRRAGITVSRSQLALEHAKHELESSRVKLATMWGDTRADYNSVKANLYDFQPVEEFQSLELLLVNNPDLVRFATEQRIEEARISLLTARQRPDLQLSGGVRYLGISDDFALVASASIPLGSGKRATNLIEASQFSSLTRPLEYEHRKLELLSTLFETYQELQHDVTVVNTFSAQIIPEAEQVLRDYEKGFSAGKYSLLELTEAQRMLLNARLEVVMAASGYHQKQIEIERLTGAALNTGTTP